jgi:WD40 repeat protein
MSFSINSITKQFLDSNIQKQDTYSISKYLPIEVLRLICSNLDDPKNVIHFGLANRYLNILFSDVPLWNSFLYKHFPDSHANLESDAKSLALYKQRTNAAHNIKNVKRNIETGEFSLKQLAWQQGYPNTVIVYKDKLISGSSDKEIKICDLDTGQELMTLAGHEGEISSIVIYKNKIISGSLDNTIKIWDINTGEELKTLRGHQDSILSIAACGDWVISGSMDETIKIWDIDTGEELKTLNGHTNTVSSVIVYDKKLISGSWDNTIKIWNHETGEELLTLTGHNDEVKCIIVYDDKIISGSRDTKIKIWDLKTGHELQTLTGHRDLVTSIVAYDNKLISSSNDKTIKIWDLKTGKELQTIDTHYNRPIKICDLKTGKEIKILNLKTGKELPTLDAHKDWITSVALCEDRIISASRDKTIKIWDFSYPSPYFEKEEVVIKPKHLPLLADLKIVSEKDYSEKLKCLPNFLPQIGICSPDDLQALWNFNSPEFQYLQITAEEVINDYAQLQVRAHCKKEIVITLLDQLLAAAKHKSDEVKQCSVIRDDNSGIVYNVPNPWIVFQETLSSFQHDLDIKTEAPKGLLGKFGPESYKELVKEVNALIDEFCTLERETRILRLSAYVKQRGLLEVWKKLHDHHGINSLAALLQHKQIAPRDIFNIGK